MRIMRGSKWKSRTFLTLSVLVTIMFMLIFFVGFGTGNQDALSVMLTLLIIVGVASIAMGIWCYASKLAKRVSTIVASVLTLLNIWLFTLFF